MGRSTILFFERISLFSGRCLSRVRRAKLRISLVPKSLSWQSITGPASVKTTMYNVTMIFMIYITNRTLYYIDYIMILLLIITIILTKILPCIYW